MTKTDQSIDLVGGDVTGVLPCVNLDTMDSGSITGCCGIIMRIFMQVKLHCIIF